MAPKKRSGKSVKAVVTTKKVVEETVRVVMNDQEETNNSQVQELVSSSTKEDQNVQVFTAPSTDHRTTEVTKRTIPVQDTTPPPPPPSPQQQTNEEDETQPVSQPEINIPAPPENFEKPGPEPRRSSPRKPPPPPRTPQKEEPKKTRKSKGAGGGGVGGGSRRRRGGSAAPAGYKRYVFKVMKQVHPELGISSKAMTVVNNMMCDMFERIAEEAVRLQKFGGRRTMSSREIEGAVKLILAGELGRHAIAEGRKAVTTYVNYNG